MGFLSEGLEPLKEAQDELLVRLDAMLVELHTVAEVLHEVRSLLATGTSTAPPLEDADHLSPNGDAP